ncbi:MAG: FAD-dependent tricarballylate dehydrogenase TcuA [Candidatus Binatia bacterium]
MDPILCDVLVLGEGIAGCSAALVAAECGAQVTILEKAPKDVPHGNTAFSGGSFRRASDSYSADKFFADIMDLSGGRSDPELTRVVVEGSRKARDWLTGLGVAWTRRSRDPAACDQAEGQGVALAAAMRRAAAAKGIRVLHETVGLSLIREERRVVGARARNEHGAIEIGCGAVVLATGGFQANPEMVVRYLGQGGAHLVLRGSPYNTGDGIRMAEELGAATDWMDDFHGGLIHYGYKKYPEIGALAGMRSMKRYEVGILINQYGKRFVDEGEHASDKTYAKFGKIVALTQPGGVAYIIFDAKNKNTVNPDYTGPEKEPIEAESLRELAGKLDIDAGGLVKAIGEFNSSIRDGKALSLIPPKTNFAQPIDTPPFCAYKVTGGFTFTFGGIRTNVRAEALDGDLKPIPGLYAAGEMVTGIFYGNYAGGSSLPRCAVFGRIAGEQAAQHAKKGFALSRQPSPVDERGNK